MAQPLPREGFERVEPEENDQILKDHNYGALVECDLHYSQRLHDNHNDYPMQPENVENSENS